MVAPAIPMLLAAAAGIPAVRAMRGRRRSCRSPGMAPRCAARPKASANKAPRVVVAVDGETVGVDAGYPEVPSQFLKTSKPGPYTVARTWERCRLMSWDLHLKRLAHGILQKSAELGLDPGTALTAHEVAEMIAPTVAAALGRYTQMGQGGPPSTDPLISQGGEVMVTILITGGGGAGGGGGTKEASAAGGSVRDIRDRRAAAVEAARGALRVWAHAAPLSQPYGAVDAAIQAPGRAMPDVKDSKWAKDREPLEAVRPRGCAEGLLGDAEAGSILEGCVTNFFVIRHTRQSEHVVLETAAVRDGVLPGIARSLVLRACRQLCVGVTEGAPHIADISIWEEAFLSNVIKVVQPIKRLHVPKGWGGRESKGVVPLPGPPGTAEPLAPRIRAAVVELMLDERAMSPVMVLGRHLVTEGAAVRGGEP